jgi:hypothetical protein
MTAAERILHSLGIADPREIDLEAIAWDQGAVVNYRPLKSCEARIVGNARNAVISVNCCSPETRQRFSIGHELGHWHHDRGRTLFCDKEDIGNYAGSALNPERLADQFASDLLLPGFLFAPRLRKIKKPTLTAVRQLADEFQASRTATLMKMTLANAFPMVIVCYKPTMERRWFERAPMLQPWWMPVRTLDTETFAADMLLKGAAEQSLPRKMPADAWFDFKNAGRFEVTEQSFLLPENEILALLTLPDEAIA